jgi:hypothetical protein
MDLWWNDNDWEEGHFYSVHHKSHKWSDVDSGLHIEMPEGSVNTLHLGSVRLRLMVLKCSDVSAHTG